MAIVWWPYRLAGCVGTTQYHHSGAELVVVLCSCRGVGLLLQCLLVVPMLDVPVWRLYPLVACAHISCSACDACLVIVYNAAVAANAAQQISCAEIAPYTKVGFILDRGCDMYPLGLSKIGLLRDCMRILGVITC